MESLHDREVLSQLFTVARFEGLTEFLNGPGGDLFCLLDFHDWFSLFRGALLPSPTPGSKRAETGERSGESGASRSE